jgi:hypothetical protein
VRRSGFGILGIVGGVVRSRQIGRSHWRFRANLHRGGGYPPGCPWLASCGRALRRRSSALSRYGDGGSRSLGERAGGDFARKRPSGWRDSFGVRRRAEVVASFAARTLDAGARPVAILRTESARQTVCQKCYRGPGSADRSARARAGPGRTGATTSKAPEIFTL